MIGFIRCGLGYLSSDQASLLPHLELPVFDDTIPYHTQIHPPDRFLGGMALFLAA